MNRKLATPLIASFVLAAGLAWPDRSDAALDGIYNLALWGDDGAHFAGNCSMNTSDGQRIIHLYGQVPHEQELVGEGLNCRLRTEGGVVVDIEHNGNRSRSTTDGGAITINLR
jgi:hypothetical protein